MGPRAEFELPSFRWFQKHSAPNRPARLIIGLGNPGPRYAHSRHNAGFEVVDRLAAKHALSFARRRFQAKVAEGEIASLPIVLAEPQTYMNLSGEAVHKLLASYRVGLDSLLVVYDDLDLPAGKLRLRARGSAGGHHGMESIIDVLHSSDFPRLRIGIGRPDSREDVSHVLGRFSAEEEDLMGQSYERAVGAIEMWIAEGVQKAMNEYNRDS